MNVADALAGSGYGPVPRATRSVYWFRRNGLEHFRQLVDPGGLRPEHAVLDVGCGHGRVAVPLTHYLRGTYDGFDVDGRAIAWCRENISREFPRFRFCHVDVRHPGWNPRGEERASDFTFPYADGSFDFALCVSTVGALGPEEVERYLSEMGRVLKPGGRGFVTWFLLNEESRGRLRRGDVRVPFAPAPGLLLATDDPSPKRIYAFDEGFVRELYARQGWTVLEPVRYGSWCGRETPGYQDLIVAARA